TGAWGGWWRGGRVGGRQTNAVWGARPRLGGGGRLFIAFRRRFPMAIEPRIGQGRFRLERRAICPFREGGRQTGKQPLGVGWRASLRAHAAGEHILGRGHERDRVPNGATLVHMLTLQHPLMAVTGYRPLTRDRELSVGHGARSSRRRHSQPSIAAVLTTSASSTVPGMISDSSG